MYDLFNDYDLRYQDELNKRDAHIAKLKSVHIKMIQYLNETARDYKRIAGTIHPDSGGELLDKCVFLAKVEAMEEAAAELKKIMEEADSR